MRGRRRLGYRAKTYTGMGRGRDVECFSLGSSPEDGHLPHMKRISRIDISALVLVWEGYASYLKIAR
jgi:hypothetical protein